MIFPQNLQKSILISVEFDYYNVAVIQDHIIAEPRVASTSKAANVARPPVYRGQVASGSSTSKKHASEKG
jgi:hypothetical protein